MRWNRISNLLAPAYALDRSGLDYRPNDNFTAFFSPSHGPVGHRYDETLGAAA
jgi:hypothetical protein